MDRADDAKKRLAALHQPIPRPTKAAVAQNRAEDESRRDIGMFGRLKSVVLKHPDVAQATKVGDPSLVDPTPVSAQDVSRQEFSAALGGGGEKSISVETVKSGTPPPNEAPPRSDTPPAGGSPFRQPAASADPNELRPTEPAASQPAGNAPADPNELKPTADAGSGDQALPPPPQVNEIQQGSSSTSTAAGSSTSSSASDEEISSSKKKKKKGLKKVVPF
jgi:outer membrane protein assembly factor BamD